MRKLAGGLAIAATVLLGSGAAIGAYPPAAVTLTLSPPTVLTNGAFTATLSGCSLGEVVTFTVESGDPGTAACTGPAGAARGVAVAAGPRATAPLVAPPTAGAYLVTGTGGTSGATASATLTVVAPQAESGQIPTTGADSAPTLRVAAGVVLLGLALTGVAIYRRRSPGTV